MKKLLLVTIAILGVSMTFAQKPSGGDPSQRVQTKRVYRIFANNEIEPEAIEAYNDSLRSLGVGNDRSVLLGLGMAIAQSYGTAFVQKTVTATSNLINLAVKWATKNKRDREQWINTARSQCVFHHTLASEVFIDDFYYLPSYNGALDPMNIKFNGFGCKSYLRPTDSIHGDSFTRGSAQAPEQSQMSPELLEFYVLCKIREDSIGLSRIANHSKFEVVLDQLVFDTRHTCLPYDSIAEQVQKPFDFKGRKDLVFNLNVKVFASWVNEAIMLFDNQQIGEFNIIALIDSSDLDENQVFVYDPAKHRDKVSVTGESFIVPRSYTGTANAPSWGTGQYRLEMTVNETCAVNERWYQKEKSNKKNPNVVQQSGRKPQWDNRKWKPEWKEMQSRQKGQSAWATVWRSVTTAYIGNDWVQEIVSPFTAAVSAQETIELNNLLNLNTSSSNSSNKGSSVPASAGSAMPQGSAPAGGGNNTNGGAPSGH